MVPVAIQGWDRRGGSVGTEVETTRLLPSSSGIGPERRLATQHAAVSALAESTSLAEAAPRLLEAVGIGLGWDFGALWMPNGNGRGTMRCVQSWSSPKLQARQFVDLCSELELEPGVGLPGRVWEEGAPVWVTDVTRDRNFARAPSAERVGLHTAFAFPVVRGGKVLGVLEFMTRDMRDPDEALLADFAVFGFQMGQFIERDAAEQQLRESRDQLEAILGSVPAGIMVLDQHGRIVFANEIAARMAGYRSTRELQAADPGDLLRGAEIFDEHGRPMPDDDLPSVKARRGVESPGVLLRFWGVGPGDHRWLMVRATPVADGRGGFLAVTVLEEISEIKWTEEALRQSETRHRSISRTLQDGLSPPRAPEVPGLEVAVRFRALGEASEIGGDFYDLFRTGERGWAVLIGDVSGKGVEAASTAALARNTVRATAQHDDDPEHVLAMLNESLLRQLPASRFCTAVYATMELGELWTRLRIGSAGHPAPLLVRSHGGTEEVGHRGPLLGGFEGARFGVEPVHLAASDSLVLYTDGVTEAGAREENGRGGLAPARLAAMLGACVGLDAEGIAQRIEDAVVEAEAGNPRDDAAIVVLRSPSSK
jgi:phosphoserine phosphatase RsbU/P